MDAWTMPPNEIEPEPGAVRPHGPRGHRPPHEWILIAVQHVSRQVKERAQADDKIATALDRISQQLEKQTEMHGRTIELLEKLAK